jgi:hypothetical protein
MVKPAISTAQLDREPLTSLSAVDGQVLTRGVVQGENRLAGLDLFDDDGLRALLDRQPRQDLMVFSTGADPTVPADWRLVDIGTADGADLVAAVRLGRFWLNVLYVDRHHPAMAELRDELFAELGAVIPGLVPESARLTLLVSSPGAVVYYHLDAGPNLLMQVRGTKRIWIYPALDPRFASRTDVEDIFAGVRIETLPYSRSFDTAAASYELTPGTLLAWPQNAPHRVENGDSMNVSLAAEFVTRRSVRRQHIWLANRFLSRSLRLPFRSTRETRAGGAAKSFVYRAARKAGLERTKPEHTFDVELALDLAAPDGLGRLDRPHRATY